MLQMYISDVHFMLLTCICNIKFSKQKVQLHTRLTLGADWHTAHLSTTQEGSF